MPGRDNGFVARHYLPLADLDPRLADAMLEVLRAESIAAYVEPSAGRLGGYLEVHLPDRPNDRLWVDREQHERAAVLLRQHTESDPLPAEGSAKHPDREFEDAWAELVANFDEPGTPTATPVRPSIEDPSAPRRIVRPAEPIIELRKSEDPAATAASSSEYDPLSVLDEHFVPPTPPKPPAMRTTTKWAITAIVGGCALIVVKELSDAVPGGIALGVCGIVGGFTALVAGMRSGRDSDDSDDGAVV